MDVNENLRQMATAKRRPTAPGMPERGSYITDPADGAQVYVTSSVQLAGKTVAYGLGPNGDERRIEL